MKRRQHVGKKRDKVRTRRKSRRDYRMLFKLVKEAPRLKASTQIDRQSLVVDEDGDCWWVDPTSRFMSKAVVRG